MAQLSPRAHGDSVSYGRMGILLAILLVVAAFAWATRRRGASPSADGDSTAVIQRERVQELASLEASENEADETSWAPERLAQQYGSIIDSLWDALNATPNGLVVLREFPFQSMETPSLSDPTPLSHGIVSRAGSQSAHPEPASVWRERVNQWLTAGWQLDQSEWHHRRFVPPTASLPASSTYDVHLHLSRLQPVSRAQITARVRIDWAQGAGNAPAGVRDIHAEELRLLTRDGAPIFREAAQFEIAPFQKTSWIDPLIIRQTRESGAELLLPGRNLILERHMDGTWEERPLSQHHPGLLFTALLADFSGDGLDDILIAVRSGLILLRGDTEGRFQQPAETAWAAPERFRYAQAFTCGDVDADGDLDVFLGQYRTPYESGQMPRPFFDANDGPPSYLLRNLGDGRFDEVTEAAGLGPKRHRRSYAASFVDLDADSDLDLVITSDFAGIDAYQNDGTGRFTDRTADWFDDPRAFGMSHSFSDWNADGRIDVLLVGMPQNTVDRLDALALERPGFEHWTRERARVAFGNRLFFGSAQGFHQRPLGLQVARAGWAWSAAAVDLDDDRFPDLHIVNGHDTRQFVREYEPEFWTHDIYVGESTPKESVDAYFTSKSARSRGLGWSYGGYHKNRLFLNQEGLGFVEAGHLFGVALEADSRNVAAVDIDGDGDADLIVTTFEVYPRPRQTLRILENTLEQHGNWITFHLRGDRGAPAMGATIHLSDRRGEQVRMYVSGDGYRSQMSPHIRFGLGDVDSVDVAEIRWSGGGTTRLSTLAANRIYDVSRPAVDRSK